MPIITVDFDHTLAYEDSTMHGGWIYIGSGVLSPIPSVIDLINEKAQQGYQIDIVTFRKDKNIQEVHDFIRLYNLPITNVYNTNQEPKTPILKRLNSQLHIDDILSVVLAADKAGIPCLLVNGNGQYDDNTIAARFNQINVNY